MDFSPEDRRKAEQQLSEALSNVKIRYHEPFIDLQCQLNAAVELLRRVQHVLPDERWKLIESIEGFLADFPVPVETKR